jgi:hypothetical protein
VFPDCRKTGKDEIMNYLIQTEQPSQEEFARQREESDRKALDREEFRQIEASSPWREWKSLRIAGSLKKQSLKDASPLMKPLR